MENRVCYPMTDVPEYLIGTITVPAGGLRPGDVVVVNVADNTIEKNFTQYYAEKPTEDTLKGDTLAIVISGGNFDELVDGRLPNGNPDYTTYVYEEGKTAPVLFLESRVMVYMSDDCFDGTVEIGDVVAGVAGSNKLSTEGDGLTKLSIDAKHEFRVGGIFGSSFVTGNICRVLPAGGAGGSGTRSGSLLIWYEGTAAAIVTDAETGDTETISADENGVVEIPDVPFDSPISDKYSSIELSDV